MSVSFVKGINDIIADAILESSDEEILSNVSVGPNPQLFAAGLFV